jgi:peptidoglycan hydrolase-like protein with peptidoglycan-binding domain
MRIRNWFPYFGAVLMLSAAPLLYSAGRPAGAQTSATTKKTASSKTKKKLKGKPKVRAQMAPTPDRIKEIQSALQREGAYDGQPTGRWDDSTADAMKKYQDKNGLSPTGKIDALSLQKLGLGSETAGKGAPVPTASSTHNPSHATQ